MARVYKDAEGKLALFTDEPLIAGNKVIPKGVRLTSDLGSVTAASGVNDKLIVTTAMESFSLYVKVSLYAAICVSVPFLLWQIWGFVLFRVFDIFKPPPIGYFDRVVKGGWGVMLDDLLASFYTLLVLAIARIILE